MIRSVTFEKTIYALFPASLKRERRISRAASGLGRRSTILRASAWRRSTPTSRSSGLCHERCSRHPRRAHFRHRQEKAGVISFSLEGVHPHDIATILDQEGIAIRTGHHCAQPVMERFGVPAMARASLAFYNTKAEIDALVAGIHKVKEVFG